MAGQTQKVLHAVGPGNGHLHILLGCRLQTQRSKFSSQIGVDKHILSPIYAFEYMLRGSLPFFLPFDHHLHPQLFLPALDSSCALPELPGLRSPTGGSDEHLHSQ